MAKLGLTHPRAVGGHLRSVVIATIAIGAMGAFIPGGHVAHAASGCFTPITTVSTTIPGGGAVSGAVSGSLPLVGGGTLGSSGVVLFNASGTVPGTSDLATGSINGAACGTLTGTKSGSITGVANVLNGLASTISYVNASGQTVNCFGPEINPTTGLPTGNTLGVTSANFTAGPASGSITTPGYQAGGATLIFPQSVNPGQAVIEVVLKCQNNTSLSLESLVTVNNTPGPGTATPELSSGELLATGLVPALGIFLYRRRRQRRAAK